MTCATACDVVSIEPISRPPALTATRAVGKSTSLANLDRSIRLTTSSFDEGGFGVLRSRKQKPADQLQRRENDPKESLDFDRDELSKHQNAHVA